MKILFIEVIHQETLYVQFSNECKRFGCEIFVLTFSANRKEYYNKNKCSCINISDYGSDQECDVKSANTLILELESRFCDYRIDQAIRKDRFLWWRNSYGHKYIKHNLMAFKKIVEKISPDIVIGEIATAFEYTLSFFCENLGVLYRQILTCPTESPSVAIYDYSMSFSNLTKYHDGEHLESVKVLGVNYYNQLARLEQQNKNRLTGRSLGDYIKNFNFIYAPNDYRTHFSYKLRFPIVKIYSVLYWFIEKCYAVNLGDDNKKRYLFALHVQPESTPDYVSINYSEQLELINRIIVDLPLDACLYIKEHAAIISLRNPIKLFKILRNKNVKLLHRKFQTRKNIKNFDIVFSICGTILLEANKSKVPAICFSNCMYTTLPYIVDFRNCESVQQALEKCSRSVKDLEGGELVWNEDFTHPGYYQDVGILPEVLNRENIENIINMIIKYVRGWEKRTVEIK